MRKQKSSKKKLAKRNSARPKRQRMRRTADLERASNEAVVKLVKRMGSANKARRSKHAAIVTHPDARRLASETLNSVARKYRFPKGSDEYRHMQACLREKADLMTGHHQPELYEI